MSKLDEILSLREEARNKDLPKAKRRRLIASAVLNTLVVLPKDLHERLREYWETIPDRVPTEMVITCVQALKAMEGGKDATNAYLAIMDAAYGKASTDDQISETYTLPTLTKEDMKRMDEEFSKEF